MFHVCPPPTHRATSKSSVGAGCGRMVIQPFRGVSYVSIDTFGEKNFFVTPTLGDAAGVATQKVLFLGHGAFTQRIPTEHSAKNL